MFLMSTSRKKPDFLMLCLKGKICSLIETNDMRNRIKNDEKMLREA